jgi:ABC-type iron transport system FetAB permease component
LPPSLFLSTVIKRTFIIWWLISTQKYVIADTSLLLFYSGLIGALSVALGLGLEKRLFISATRCVVQLTIMVGVVVAV